MSSPDLSLADKPSSHRCLQNRVHADGSLIATSARGTLMGNRGGRFHDPATQNIKKRVPWAGKQWISCVLQFKGRKRTVWAQGYTELFFLDEVTALSAGHRPCFECRREDAKAFQQALFLACGKQQGWKNLPKVAVMDALLHNARLEAKPCYTSIKEVPAGALFKLDGDIYAKTPDGARFWSIENYGERVDVLEGTDVRVLTPAPIVTALVYGYKPKWHSSAGTFNDG